MRSLKERIAMREASLFAVLLFSLHIQKIDMAEIDIISDSQFLTVNDTLVWYAGKFEQGFFKLGSSKNMYLGIWYKKISVKTVVWVANRNRPLTSASSGLRNVVHPSNLVLMNNATELIWASNTTSQLGNAIVNLMTMEIWERLRERRRMAFVIMED
nr:G-type lectin S-receptor-like serine/threonine-protein kinase At4g27290 [Tanacetum cinerariifolium]